MAKYRFRLATLLKLREAARDERRAYLAEAYQAETILRERAEQWQQERSGLMQSYEQASAPGKLDVDRLLEAQRYELVVRTEQARLGKQQQALEAEVQRRREALTAADREVRVLEKLRETQVVRNRQEEGRQEIKFLDELAGRAAQREET